MHSPSRSWLFRIAKIGWIFFLVAVVIWLVVADIVPSGTVVVNAWPATSPFMGDPVPLARVDRVAGDNGSAVFRVREEPIYIDVQQPRPFRVMTVELQLEPGGSEVVELGLAVKGHEADVSLQPAFHRALEGLPYEPGWQVRRERGLTLLQRQPTYTDITAFFRNPPEASRVAAYRVPFVLAFPTQPMPATGPTAQTDFVITGYQPGAGWEGWRMVRAEFTLTPEQASARELRLIISVPGRPLPLTPVQFGHLTMTLSGEPANARVISGWLTRWFRRD